MSDASRDMLLMVLFGIGGITILVVACLRPMFIMERILTISVGSFGLLWAFVKVLVLKSGSSETGKPWHLK